MPCGVVLSLRVDHPAAGDGERLEPFLAEKELMALLRLGYCLTVSRIILNKQRKRSTSLACDFLI